MNKKRVLFMAGASYVSGAELTNFNLIRDLHSKGYPLYVIVNGWNDGDFIKRLSKINVPYKEIKLGFIYLSKPLWTLDTLLHLPKALFQLFKILKEFKPDWVFHCSYRTLFMGQPLFKRYENIYREHNDPQLSHRNKKIYSFLNRNVKRIVCPSRAVKKTLIQLGLTSEKISIVPSPLDPEFGSNLTVYEEHRPLHLGIVGQIIPDKGFTFLFDVLKEIERDFLFFIYGKDTSAYVERLKREMPRNLLPKIKWMGFVQNRIEIYNNIDILIFPTKSEASGRVALEAGAFGIPVIASNVGGMPESILHEKTGLLFDFNKPADLKDYVETLLKNAALRKELGDNAKEYVWGNFKSDNCTQKFEQVINE